MPFCAAVIAPLLTMPPEKVASASAAPLLPPWSPTRMPSRPPEIAPLLLMPPKKVVTSSTRMPFEFTDESERRLVMPPEKTVTLKTLSAGLFRRDRAAVGDAAGPAAHTEGGGRSLWTERGGSTRGGSHRSESGWLELLRNANLPSIGVSVGTVGEIFRFFDDQDSSFRLIEIHFSIARESTR